MSGLGINIASILINTVLFFVFVAILHKFLLSKLADILSQREHALNETEKNEQKAQKMLEDATTEHNKSLEEAKIEKAKVLATAKGLAEKERQALLAQSKIEAEEVIKKGKELLISKEEELRKQLDTEIDEKVKIKLREILKDQADKMELP